MNKNTSNLISFLVTDWYNRIPTKIAGGRSLVLGYEVGNAVEIKSDGCSDIQDLTCDHEEQIAEYFCSFAVVRQECSQIKTTRCLSLNSTVKYFNFLPFKTIIPPLLVMPCECMRKMVSEQRLLQYKSHREEL